MMFRKFKTALGALVTISACLLLMAPAAMADKAAGVFKLEGAWIAKVVGMPGQWSYVLSPDPSGRRAALAGSIDVGFSLGGLFPPTDRSSMLMANLVLTGPKTGMFNSIWYGLRALPPTSPISDEVLWIGMSTGTFTLVESGKIEVVHNFAFYAPSQYADGDGLPDPDEVPVYTMQLNTVDTRQPLPE